MRHTAHLSVDHFCAAIMLDYLKSSVCQTVVQENIKSENAWAVLRPYQRCV